jgi:hypothetical protein
MSATGLIAVVGSGALIAGFLAAGKRARRRQRARIAVAQTFDLSNAVSAHMWRIRASPTYVQRLDYEFRRWFVVAAASSTMIGMGSQAVDDYWHTLLSTDGGELYAEFSEAVAGRLIEHVEGVGSPDLDAKAWVAYEAVWGTPPPADLFPEPSEDLKAKYRARATDSGSGGGGDSGGSVSVDVSSCGGSSSSGCDGGGGSSCGGGSGCGGGGGGGG